MECSPLNAHLYALHVIENPSCNCGYQNEDTDHFFLACPLFNLPRQSLRNTVNKIAINIHTSYELIFGSPRLTNKENIELCNSVHQYILETNRFS